MVPMLERVVGEEGEPEAAVQGEIIQRQWKEADWVGGL